MPNLELRPHPSRRENRITGKPEPNIKDTLSIWLDGVMIGYCGAVPNRPVTLIKHFEASECDLILEYVASKRLSPSRIVCAPKLTVEIEPSLLWTPDDDE